MWALLGEPRDVVACLPGASLGERRADGRYPATIAVRVGPISVEFSGLATITPDEGAGTVAIRAEGRDRARTTRAAADISVSLSAEGAGSAIEVRGAFEFAGPLAHLAESVGGSVAARTMAAFAEGIARRVVPPDGGTGSEGR